MAKRKRYGGLVDVSLAGFLPQSKEVKDVGAGALIGLAGAALAKYADKKFAFTAKFGLPALVINNLSALGAAGAGAAAFFLQKKSARGKAHFAGALGIAAALAGWALLQQKFGFADVVGVRLGDYGLMIDENPAGFGGFPINEPAGLPSAYGRNAHLADLQAVAMSGARDENLDWAGVGDDWFDA